VFVSSFVNLVVIKFMVFIKFHFLHEEGCVFIGIIICLLARLHKNKILILFSQNSISRWHVGHTRNHEILAVICVMLTLGLRSG